MKLTDYLAELARGQSLRSIAKASGVSYGGVQAIFAGETETPTPDVLQRLARYFGRDEDEQRVIYEELMRLAGYLDFFPLPRRSPVDERVDEAYRSGQEMRARQKREHEELLSELEESGEETEA
jgi:transcriptional regulator with XRE-family HTH domain